MENVQLRQLIRESIQEYIREVETSGNIAAQEAKIKACEEAIALREKKANLDGLDEAYHDMMDSTKINELKKEIKELQKYKTKAEKVLEKMKSKAEGKGEKKIEDEGMEEGTVDEVNIDEYTSDPESGPQLEEEDSLNEMQMLHMQKLAGIISEKEYNEKLEEAKKKPSAGLTKKQKSAVSKKAHAGKDIGKKGKGFEKVAKAAGGGEKGEKIAAAAMWKSEAKKKAKSLKEEVRALFEETKDLLSMLQDYISAHYTADQGYGEGVVEKAEADMERIEAEVTRMKGAEYFEALKDFAGLVTYDNEYAGPEESDEIQPQLEDLSHKLGFTVDQLKGL